MSPIKAFDEVSVGLRVRPSIGTPERYETNLFIEALRYDVMATDPKVGVGYNAQVAVDAKHKLIVEQHVTNAGSDLELLAQTADRLGRSLPQLLTTVIDLKGRCIPFRSLTEQMDTTTAQGELVFQISAHSPSSNDR